MAPPSYSKQLEDAKEALALIVAGQLESHSTLAGSFKNWSPAQMRDHIEWLEQKSRQETPCGDGERTGTSYFAYSAVRTTR